MRTATPEKARNHREVPGRNRWIAALIGFEAATLAVFSALHLSGVIHGGSKPFDASDAGIAEAIICVALAAGAIALLRAPARGRPVALAATVFAIAGFIAGLTFTVRGGGTPDITYHATMLPVLIATVILLARSPARVHDDVG
jgi:drug/metabolite transporter (DMT)-like permease